MLKVASLVAGYGSLTVLKELSFEVPSGKVVALLGGNGGGKTTTLRTIVGLIRPRSGTIAFNGTRIDGYPPHRVFALVVAELHGLIERICRAGTTVLLVEQNIKLALSVAHYVYVIRNGSIATEGDPSSFRDQRVLFNSYIG